MGLLQDNDSVGGTNSNPNLHKADTLANSRNIRDPRGSAAPGRLISKVRDGKVTQVYQQTPSSRQQMQMLYGGNQTPASGKLI
jgi:hypothetical protein